MTTPKNITTRIAERFLQAGDGQLKVNLTKSKSLLVSSYAEASEAVRKFWNAKSSRAFYRDPKAGVIEKDGEATAHVSYNGRVWKGTNRMSIGDPEIKI